MITRTLTSNRPKFVARVIMIRLSTGSSPLLILEMSDHFQMIWVAADTVVTLVIDLLFAGYIPKKIGEHDYVNCDSLSIETHTTIPTSTTFSRVRSGPFPTTSVFVDDDSGHDFIENGFSTICEGGDFHWFFPISNSRRKSRHVEQKVNMMLIKKPPQTEVQGGLIW